MPHAMNTTEIFLIAMTIIFTVPYFIWRVGKTDYWAPLVVVQIITGILLGPGILPEHLNDDTLGRALDALYIYGVTELFRELAAHTDTLRARLRDEIGDGFPEKVTAFREGMAVHGRYGQPCPACGTAVQRVIYAENEANYCPTCQTGGKLLADRVLSRLMKDDWPKTLEELEAKRR